MCSPLPCARSRGRPDECHHHVLRRACARAHAVRVGCRHSRAHGRAAAGRFDHGHVRLDVDRRQGSRRSVLLFGAAVRVQPGRRAVRLDAHPRAGAVLGQVQPGAAAVRLAAAAAGAAARRGCDGERRAPLDAHRPDELSSLRTVQGAGADLGVQLLRAQANGARANPSRSRQAGRHCSASPRCCCCSSRISAPPPSCSPPASPCCSWPARVCDTCCCSCPRRR